ncbi:hypothetical protein ACFO6V_07245 [Promicromonospora alba]|uniref:Uncharacterized protein n=1 Tax=Promicromonospora alba TaxID=1616110 RepID=A0ABV9HFV1_9MICO
MLSLPSRFVGFVLAFNWPVALALIAFVVIVGGIVFILFWDITPCEKAMILRALGDLVHGADGLSRTECP